MSSWTLAVMDEGGLSEGSGTARDSNPRVSPAARWRQGGTVPGVPPPAGSPRKVACAAPHAPPAAKPQPVAGVMLTGRRPRRSAGPGAGDEAWSLLFSWVIPSAPPFREKGPVHAGQG